MFKRRRSHKDFSTHLRNAGAWNTNPRASRIEPVDSICTLGVDTPSRLLAVGTSNGDIRIFDDNFKEAILVTPHRTVVKLLHFARPRDLFKLLCIDGKNILHIWNLDAYGAPPLQASHPLDGPIYSVASSESHSHALLATRSGVVVTYDLAALRLSPYSIPYVFNGQDHLAHGPVIDVVIHPNKLNHVLVGYEGGTVLYNLLSQKVLKTFALASMPPLSDNSPYLTALAFHPLGQLFAAGCGDGTVSIWDLRSSTTIWVGTPSQRGRLSDVVHVARDPVFKMEWSLTEGPGVPGDSTSWLTILGGLPLSNSSNNGISVLQFDTASLHAANAESASPLVLGLFLYPIPLSSQDFVIIPAKTTLPTAHGRIVVLLGRGDQTSVDAFEFPPQFDASPTVPLEEADKDVILEFSTELEESKQRSQSLANLVDDLSTDSTEHDEGRASSTIVPVRVSLPLPLLIYATSVLAAGLISVNKPEYLRLVRRSDDDSGITSKDHRCRILITCHKDGSIRFHDVSALSDGVDLSLRPLPLEYLTIHVLEIPEIALRADIQTIHIVGVAIATESLECAVLLSTGETVLLGLGLWHRTQDVLDNEIADITDSCDRGDVFSPRFILSSLNGGADKVCLSDIGFLAVAFKHGLLLVVDLRGPKIILRDDQDATSKKYESNVVKTLYWTVSGLGEDSTQTPRLLALRYDGILTIYTLTQSDGAWVVDNSRTTRDMHHSLSAPILSIVLDARTGTDCWATQQSFADAVKSTLGSLSLTEGPSHSHCFWVAANQREIRNGLNITGDRVSKVSLASQDALDHISLVKAQGSSVLVGFSRGQAVVYSLPSLEAICALQLPVAMNSAPLTSCTPAGDLLQTCQSTKAGITLVFTSLLYTGPPASGSMNLRAHKYAKRSLPEIDTQDPSHQTWGSWIMNLGKEEAVTGNDIDLILAGPNVLEAPEVPNHLTEASSVGQGSTRISGKGSAGGSAGTAVQGMYQQMTSAVTERGERLGRLEEHFESLEADSKDMVVQAKKLAERQTAKRWFF